MAYQGEGGIADIRRRIYRERGTVTLNANGQATVTLANAVPSASTYFIHLTPWISPGTEPVIANVSGWTTSGSNTTGFTIEASRMRGLPNPLALLSELVGFRPWLGTNANGVRVDWMIY